MIETKEVTLGKDVFSISQFLADEGLEIKAVLINLLSESVPGLFSDVKSLSGVLDVDIGKQGISIAIGKLMKQMNSDTVKLIKRMLTSSSSLCNNSPITKEIFNVHFAGNYMQLYKLIYQIIDFNYGRDFFGEGGIGTLLEEAQVEKKKA